MKRYLIAKFEYTSINRTLHRVLAIKDVLAIKEGDFNFRVEAVDGYLFTGISRQFAPRVIVQDLIHYARSVMVPFRPHRLIWKS